MKIVVALMMALLLTSCAGNVDKMHATELDNYDEVTLSKKLNAGVTSKKDLLLLLGRPYQPADYNQSNTWIYRSWKTDWRMYFFIPFDNSKDQTLSLNFNENGVLRDYRYSDKKKK